MAETPYPFSVCEEINTMAENAADKPYPFSVCSQCCTGGGGEGGPLQSKTVTPSESSKKVTPDKGYYGLSDVTVEAIPDIYKDVSLVSATPETVLQGTSFVNVDGFQIGEMPNNGNVSAEIDGVNVTSVTIPAGYTSGGTVTYTGSGGGVPEGAFVGAVYPWLELNDVDIIANKFKNGVGLEGARTVLLPNVKTIGGAAFMNASEVEVIDIGPNIQSVNLFAFNGCSKLVKLIIRGMLTTKPSLSGAPVGSGTYGYVYVPDEYVEQYKANTNWSSLAAQIKPISEL